MASAQIRAPYRSQYIRACYAYSVPLKHRQQTYFWQMCVPLDRTANKCCVVTVTARGEPNFVSFLHKHKMIVMRNAGVFLVLNSYSRTAHLISVFEKLALPAHQNYVFFFVTVWWIFSSLDSNSVLLLQVARVSYELLNINCSNHSVISVDQTGLISTSGKYGMGSVQVHAVEDSDQIHSEKVDVRVSVFDHFWKLIRWIKFKNYVCISQVSRVQYVMLNIIPDLRIHPISSVSGLPKGAKLWFSVSYHDNEGSEFNAANNKVKLQTNKLDKVRKIWISLGTYSWKMLWKCYCSMSAFFQYQNFHTTFPI